MTDIYHIGLPSGLSAEVPIPVIKISETKRFPGGAGNVVENLLSLGIEAWGIEPSPQLLRPLKHRLMAGDHQIARWDEHDYCARTILPRLPEADAYVVSDYDKGAVTPELIKLLNATDTPVFIDTKRSPGYYKNDVNRLFFPNEHELRKHSGYDTCRHVVKRGGAGMEYYTPTSPGVRAPGISVPVRCVNGAGDSAMAGYVSKFLAGGCIEECLAYANAAGAVAVSKPYTATVSNAEIETLLKS